MQEKRNAPYSKGDEVFGRVVQVGRTHLTIGVGERTTGRIAISNLLDTHPGLTEKALRAEVEVGDQFMATVAGKSRGALVLTRSA